MTKIRIHETNDKEKAAYETLQRTVLHDGKISLPVDVLEIAKKLGLETYRMNLDDKTDGLLVKDKPDEPFKAISKNTLHPHRERFTFAHEIGHYVHKYQDWPEDKVAGKVERRDELSSMAVNDEEIWANGFAAALLMPSGIVTRMWGDNWRIEDMAKAFNVSLAAMGHRIENLGLR